jgi:hypothetical protein
MTDITYHSELEAEHTRRIVMENIPDACDRCGRPELCGVLAFWGPFGMCPDCDVLMNDEYSKPWKIDLKTKELTYE